MADREKAFNEILRDEKPLRIRCSFAALVEWKHRRYPIDELQLMLARINLEIKRAVDGDDPRNLPDIMKDAGVTLKDHDIYTMIFCDELIKTPNRVFDRVIFQALGDHAKIRSDTLVLRVKDALNLLTKKQKNGEFGSPFDEEKDQQYEEHLRNVVRDVAKALTDCEITFRKKKD